MALAVSSNANVIQGSDSPVKDRSRKWFAGKISIVEVLFAGAVREGCVIRCGTISCSPHKLSLSEEKVAVGNVSGLVIQPPVDHPFPSLFGAGGFAVVNEILYIRLRGVLLCRNSVAERVIDSDIAGGEQAKDRLVEGARVVQRFCQIVKPQPLVSITQIEVSCVERYVGGIAAHLHSSGNAVRCLINSACLS